jgi:hypothetical protein
VYTAPRPRSAAPPKEPSPPRKPLETVKASNKNFGRVPAYLQKINADLVAKREEELKQIEAARNPTKRLLTSEEKQVMIAQLRKRREEVLLALHQLPLGRDNISLQLRKKEFESEICQLDKDLRKYDRLKVYVDK